jgi:hypothetical protein
MRIVSGLKMAMIMSIYFSVCAIVILLLLGARP